MGTTSNPFPIDLSICPVYTAWSGTDLSSKVEKGKLVTARFFGIRRKQNTKKRDGAFNEAKYSPDAPRL